MNRENLRRVKCRYWANKVKFGDALGEQAKMVDPVPRENEGYFHEWNGEEAIIELENGTIIQTPYWFVQFMS